MKKMLLALDGNDVAPRFDFAMELSIVSLDRDGNPSERKDLVLERPSAEGLCRVITSENVDTVLCGGIEKDHIQYLGWKNITVIHSVIGPSEVALNRLQTGTLKSGDMVFEKWKA